MLIGARLAWLRQRLTSRADSEHEQAFTRFVVVPGMLAYMLWAPQPPERWSFVLTATILIFVAGMSAASAIIAHILWRPGVSPTRRVLGMVVDVGGVGASMLVGGVSASAFFPLLLWIILGHGFRYGRPYLIAATGTSVVAFALVLAFSPEWRQMPYIGVGLLLALIMLPAYFAVLLTKLTHAIQRAEEASRAKSHFVAAVSHEFRTPLNAVIGMSELLRTTRLSPDQGDMVATIRAAATGLLGLVNNVLDLAKLEAQRFTVDVAPYDLHQVLATVRHILFHQARSKGLHLRLRLAPDLPYRLRGDGRALQQVLLNLAGNAVKFTEQGGIVIEVGLIGARPGPGRLRFEVRDTGLGLSPAAQASIFERFAQADETRRKVIGGTGLGLSIARELVELMGGTIGVTSKQGVGSCFSFELPLAEAAEADGFEEPVRSQVIVLGSRTPATAARRPARPPGLQGPGGGLDRDRPAAPAQGHAGPRGRGHRARAARQCRAPGRRARPHRQWRADRPDHPGLGPWRPARPHAGRPPGQRRRIPSSSPACAPPCRFRPAPARPMRRARACTRQHGASASWWRRTTAPTRRSSPGCSSMRATRSRSRRTARVPSTHWTKAASTSCSWTSTCRTWTASRR